MASYDLDDLDRKLLMRLQENARYSANELAAEFGVSDTTVHNRIDRLAAEGVITGYSTSVDHDRIGLSMYFMFTCTARISQRDEMADEILKLPSVVEVTELMTGHRNLHVKVVAAEDDEITRIAEEIDELDVEINDEDLVRAEHSRPLAFTDSEVERMLDGEE